MARGQSARREGSTDPKIDAVLQQLNELEEVVDDAEERRHVDETRALLYRLPGGERIQKFTGRDMGEAFIGSLVFAVPLLVEDGVFDIAAWFAAVTLGSVPILLALNVVFVVGITAGLLYAVDIREVEIHNPFVGVVPRRLVGVLLISLGCTVGMMLMWGRLHAGDPTPVEALGRTTIVWAAAALGAVLGDILPGESKGEDLSALLDELSERSDLIG